MSNRFNRISIYALNKKDSDAIVYPTADGKTVRVTREDFPSEADFLAFKAWSDENFHEEENLDHRESNHTLSMDDLSEAALAVPAADVVMEHRQQRAEQRRATSDMILKLKDKLTDKQFRRMWMKYSDGRTEEEIAKIEGATQQAISLSIVSALEKIEKKKIFF